VSIFTRSKKKEPSPNVGPRDTQLPQELLWLADAPMFIDERRVDAFYDAVFRPDYGETTRTLQEKVTRDTKLGGGLTLGSLLPGLFAKADATVSAEHSRGRERGQELALQPISNAYRHLLALALHYSTAKQGRLVLARTPHHARDGAGNALGPDWLLPDSDFIRTPPRAMILLDLTEGCKLIPAAVELSNGTVKPLFEDLAKGFGEKANTPAPEYPGSHADLAERNAYWQWFAENFDDRVALDAVEGAVDGQKIQWIAYRVSFGDDTGPFLHLALAARGAYDTGVFGYNFINRGTKHGLRLVGTLKTEPDIDVLAVFER
jgi:hypothetical protein